MTESQTADAAYSPAHYIEKVSLASGDALDEPIPPEQLLVQNHRDYHVVDVYARVMMGKLVDATGNEELVRQAMKEIRKLGHKAAGILASAVGIKEPERVSSKLFGLKDREYYFRYKRHLLEPEVIESRLEALKREAQAQLAAASTDARPALRVLVTGGTGFVGKEILWQAAHLDAISELVVLIRPKTIRDRKTKEVIKTLSPADRGRDLLRHLWLDDSEAASKFTFIAGDIEQPNLGIGDDDLGELERTITHVIHCAASVSFDAPYEESYEANVSGSLNALRFSHRLQNAEGSPFVAHLSIETSYIHGRQVRDTAREDEMVFPRNFYNNYYELTKGMASIETERFMLEKGLRVTQLCPAIVIGESRAGNNRGDQKVVNAPVNAFGRAHQAMTEGSGGLSERSTSWVIAKMATVFPGDPSAELNLIPVDWVAKGILAALTRPKAVGERIHLATDNRLTSAEIRDTVRKELGVEVTLSEPTFHRNVRLPLLTRLLGTLKQDKLANALEKLGTIFGGYSEWGQPVHEVGNDVRLLGLPGRRPNTKHAFRMLCRHNAHVQDFGQIRDDDEIAQRERVWWGFIEDLERLTGGPAGALSAEAFKQLFELAIDAETFERKRGVEYD